MAAAGVIAAFILPRELEAAEPPEARGLRRDEVRLLVSRAANDSIEHARFNELPRLLSPGDLLVVNNSGTLNAALTARSDAGELFELHVSTRLPGGFWTVELRESGAKRGAASLPSRRGYAGAVFVLPADATATLLAPYPFAGSMTATSRLWIAALRLPMPALSYFDRFGFPIRYSYVARAWPPAMYQTVFAAEPGSAEMPSAGRPFTTELVTALVSRGIQVAPLTLHTGVASLEDHEPPYEEFYRVPPDTAERVTAARQGGRRVIAVGTTVVRALETVTDDRGRTFPAEGWTNVVITPDRALRSVDGMITGLHEPRATHLAMLERVVASAASRAPGGPHETGRVTCARCHLERAYAEARAAGYLWHEFGDSHLIL